MSLALLFYLQLILVIGEKESGSWGIFAFISGLSFAVLLISIICYEFLVKKPLNRFCTEVLKEQKIIQSFRRMRIAVAITMILQGTAAGLTAKFGGPTFGWFFNNYGLPGP